MEIESFKKALTEKIVKHKASGATLSGTLTEAFTLSRCLFNYLEEKHKGQHVHPGDASLINCIEEFSELIQVCTKRLRGDSKDEYLHALEEYADALITLNYVKLAYNFKDDEIAAAVDTKMDYAYNKMKEGTLT